MALQLDLNNFDACPQYNDWLDEQFAEKSGTLNILGFQPRPSYVLFSLSQDTYQATFSDFLQQREEDLKEAVFNEFPTPIAYYFYRFENGYESELQRLHLLRDTWEAIIDILHALAIAECRFHRMSLADPIAFSHFLSDSMVQRLLNIERIISAATSHGIALSVSNIAAGTTLVAMRELNRNRNAFSHSAAQSEAQARFWVGECYAEVLDILEELSGLANVEVFRYMWQVDGNTLRCEVFRGYGSTRTIRNRAVNSDQIRESQRYFQQGQILLIVDEHIHSLRPMVYYREDVTGHSTKLCTFRKTHGDAPNRRVEYEVVGEATRFDEGRAVFSAELSELRGLFGLGPD